MIGEDGVSPKTGKFNEPASPLAEKVYEALLKSKPEAMRRRLLGGKFVIVLESIYCEADMLLRCAPVPGGPVPRRDGRGDPQAASACHARLSVSE